MKSSIKSIKKKWIITIGYLFFSVSVFARSKQEVIPAGHWIFDNLTRVVMDSGRTDFVFYGPMTLAEIDWHLNKIDYESLSEDAVRSFDRSKEYISYE